MSSGGDLPAAAAAALIAAALFAAPAAARDGEEADSAALIAATRERLSPVRRCQPAADGAIVVCGDTGRDRLSPELRDIAGVGKSVRDSIPPAPAINPLSLDRLPYNWFGPKGVLFRRPRPNPLLQHVRAMEAARAADAESEAKSEAGERGGATGDPTGAD